MTVGPRLQLLDCIRAFGVMLVIAYHTSYRFAPAPSDLIGRGLRVVGWIGVDLFFALSGFLVATILSRESTRRNIASFYQKRLFRIVPIYFVAIAVFAISDAVVAEGANLANIWKSALFLTGYLQPLQGAAVVPFTITWSLSVEVTAYIAMGLLAWRFWTYSCPVLIAVVLISPVLRSVLTGCAHWDEAMIGIFPPARLDAIALGALAALGQFDRLLRHRRSALIYGTLTILIIVSFRFAAWYPPFISTIGYSIFGLAAALWVTALARVDLEHNWITGFGAQIGLVSYFMYLFHIFVIEGLLVVQDTTGLHFGFWLALCTATAVTYGAALVSWQLFEQPLIRYASRPAARASLVT